VKYLLSFLLCFLVSCGSPKPVAQEIPTAQIDPATGAVIAGKVTFSGKAPVMPVLDMSASPQCERLSKGKPRRSEEVIVNANGTLKNAFVWIKSGLPNARWNPPAEVAKLDQQGCVYEPHVLGLMVGQTLQVFNSDTVNHNIHADAQVNEGWNMSEPPQAETRKARFSKQEVMFPVTCGVHPWMRSYLAVVSHPFFAVSDEKGAFSLNGVPPGTYGVEAVHEKYGRKEMQITIGAKESKSIEFHYDEQ
jgi:plastocyanin